MRRVAHCGVARGMWPWPLSYLLVANLYKQLTVRKQGARVSAAGSHHMRCPSKLPCLVRVIYQAVNLRALIGVDGPDGHIRGQLQASTLWACGHWSTGTYTVTHTTGRALSCTLAARDMIYIM